ncbi:molybdopterin molybdotransferase MoeA [Anaerotruncus rubiinfantis]|uniref:molybdopterin molybdotransferase MoeA n=1 Tax=Anaerotruncus rubiinfantis TaxID=1720200 RepID=UPI0009AC4F25|nr:gephyrin-like molybdotransferase Glp [Anaerotruncus rubiinfantis]
MNQWDLMGEGLEYEAAVALLLEHTPRPKSIETLPLLDALGRIAGADIISPISHPPFDRSPLDGYALRARGIQFASPAVPARLSVAGKACAGEVFPRALLEGEALRVMTGAMLPAGCDCVIRQEDTDYGEDTVSVYAPVKPYENYCFGGEDIPLGTVLLRAGEQISFASAGILAGVGISQAPVYEAPKVGIICTGDELSDPGTPLAPGKIYNSNRTLLCARLRELGMTEVAHPSCPDDPKAICKGIDQIWETADLIVTTGGVSVGQRDWMRTVVDLLGAQPLFWRMRLKPGSPALCALYKGKLLICLSGNPFAALATFELLLRPVLRRLSGMTAPVLTRKTALCQNDFPKGGCCRRFVRGIYEDQKVYIQKGNHSSSALLLCTGCNCFVDIPVGQGPLKAGDTVSVLML